MLLEYPIPARNEPGLQSMVLQLPATPCTSLSLLYAALIGATAATKTSRKRWARTTKSIPAADENSTRSLHPHLSGTDTGPTRLPYRPSVRHGVPPRCHGQWIDTGHRRRIPATAPVSGRPNSCLA